ncbi:translation protein [Ramicandelaber brevisporus]|nr:translation protein [Ramicandelaber brevisporus]
MLSSLSRTSSLSSRVAVATTALARSTPASLQLVSSQFFRSASTSATSTSTSATSTSPAAKKAESVRTGVIAIKKGMTSMFDEWGVHIPVTILQLQHVQVVQVINPPAPGHSYRLQVGAENCTDGKVTKPLVGHFKAHGVRNKRIVAEFPVTPDALLPPGTPLNANHFIPGQLVDVQAPSTGKGFQGVMKRWGFAGGNASHGASLSHRSAGSTGASTNPSRVWKGKKMAGRMGGENVTVLNLKVMKVDTALRCIWVKGAVPGYDGQYIKVRDAVKHFGKPLFPEDQKLPFPTALGRRMLGRSATAEEGNVARRQMPSIVSTASSLSQ